MAKYLFVYHGGNKPENAAEINQVLQAWGSWFGSLGESVIDGSNPVVMSSTVNSDGSVTQQRWK